MGVHLMMLRTQKGPVLGFMLCSVLKFLIYFEQRAVHFHLDFELCIM